MFVPPQLEQQGVRTVQSVSNSLCLTLKFENRAVGPRGVRFCQHCHDGTNLIPNPLRVYNKLAGGPIHKDTEWQRARFRERKGAALRYYLRAYPTMPLIANLLGVLGDGGDTPDCAVLQ